MFSASFLEPFNDQTWGRLSKLLPVFSLTVSVCFYFPRPHTSLAQIGDFMPWRPVWLGIKGFTWLRGSCPNHKLIRPMGVKHCVPVWLLERPILSYKRAAEVSCVKSSYLDWVLLTFTCPNLFYTLFTAFLLAASSHVTIFCQSNCLTFKDREIEAKNTVIGLVPAFNYTSKSGIRIILANRFQLTPDGSESWRVPEAADAEGHREGEEEHDVLHEPGCHSRKFLISKVLMVLSCFSLCQTFSENLVDFYLLVK